MFVKRCDGIRPTLVEHSDGQLYEFGAHETWPEIVEALNKIDRQNAELRWFNENRAAINETMQQARAKLGNASPEDLEAARATLARLPEVNAALEKIIARAEAPPEDASAQQREPSLVEKMNSVHTRNMENQ
jgi:hypothetical protein